MRAAANLTPTRARASVAQECEAGMNAKLGGTGKEYKTRFRSLMFNLQDPKVRLPP